MWCQTPPTSSSRAVLAQSSLHPWQKVQVQSSVVTVSFRRMQSIVLKVSLSLKANLERLMTVQAELLSQYFNSIFNWYKTSLSKYFVELTCLSHFIYTLLFLLDLHEAILLTVLYVTFGDLKKQNASLNILKAIECLLV